MHRRRFLATLPALATVACASRPIAAQANGPFPDDLLISVSRAAQYIAQVLVTPEGKGRADYDLMSGQWLEYEPHWHTGQQILALVQAWRLTGEATLLDAARRAGDWWISTEFRPPHPLAGLVNAYHGDHVGRLINFTTISDGTPGLFALSAATGDRRYADCATRSGAWLYANTKVPDADELFYNMIDPDAARVVTDFSPHHRDVTNPGVTLVARPNIEGYLFADMYRHTGEPIWRDRFLAQAEGALRWQHANGLWMDFEPNDPERGRVHPRFNVWNAEALLVAHELTGDGRFLDAALRTARFMQRVQDRNGSIYYDLSTEGTWSLASITGSAVAFSAILWLRLRDAGVGAEFTESIERSRTWLLANQFPDAHPDPNLRGAFLETRVRFINGAARIAMRDISSSFGVRFLCDYARSVYGAAGHGVSS
jgi:hypothetical protein